MTKNKNRVSPLYKQGTKEWNAQYNMLLDDSVTCAQCIYFYGNCGQIFGAKPEGTKCQWFPNCFQAFSENKANGQTSKE